MSALPLTIACWDYDRTRAIMDGRVKVEGCDVNYLPLAVEETFFRAFRSAEFDACELSFSTYLLSLSRERDFGIPLPYRAVPAFVSRVFRHSGIYIRTDRGIRSPADLKGKVVGVPEYQMTAAVWIRGILEHEYGVPTASMSWRNGGIEEPGRTEKVLHPEVPSAFHWAHGFDAQCVRCGVNVDANGIQQLARWGVLGAVDLHGLLVPPDDFDRSVEVLQLNAPARFQCVRIVEVLFFTSDAVEIVEVASREGERDGHQGGHGHAVHRVLLLLRQ